MADHKVTLDIKNIPELMAELRAEMAKLLRTAAEDEPRAVAQKLLELADIFEVGWDGSE